MTKTKPISNEQATIALYWQLCRQHPRRLWATLAIPISSVAIGSVVPLFIGKTLASLQHPAVHHLRYLLPLMITAAVGYLTNRIGFGNLLTMQAKVMSTLQQLSLDTLQQRSVGFHNNRVSGKLVSDAIDLQQSFNSLSNVFFVNIVPLSVTLLSGVVLVGISSWVLGLTLLIMIVVTLGSGVRSTLGRSELRARRQAVSKQVTAHLADTIVNQQTVKTFAQETAEMTTHRQLNHDLRDLRVNDWVTAAHSNSSRIALLLAFQIAFVVVIVAVTTRDPNQLAAGIFAFTYTVTLTNRLLDVGTMIRTIEDSFLQSEPMIEIIAEQPEILDVIDASELHAKQGAIELREVTFSYKDATSSPEVFEKLNLSIKPGEKIGLIGPSGGGKSTLTRLLLRFEDIDNGCISIDGQDIAGVTQASLRQAIAYVPQEPLLFHRPISANIAYGAAEASLAAIRSAAQKAYADDFITALPAGYDTIVGERGVKLSGGQRQRVAIARAILKDAPILILDEATSALDSESEKAIQAALNELMTDKTALVIAHRLSTIQRMDRIIVMDNGQILEQGTHAELLKQKGLYARLWKHQSGGFLED